MIELNFPKLAPTMASWSAPAHMWLPDPLTLSRACAQVADTPPPEGLESLLAGMGAPSLDVLVTLMSARAALLGLGTGRAFVHHELRGRLPMPKGLEPEISVWDTGSTVPVWDEGVLQEPKYFSFFQDAPLPVFNPNHRRKWRAHELLHAAQGFFWHPSMTRFAFYLGARVNELLPVVHWYGFDEAFRPRCGDCRDAPLSQRFCPACEAAARPFWQGGSEFDPDVEARWFERGLEHFSSEWAACLEELQTGRRSVTPRPGLNASSDAVGYLRGHWNRVTSWSFGAWVEMFMVEGEDYFGDLGGYMGRVASVARQLTSGTVGLGEADFTARRARRVLQDVGYRAFLALEWLEEGSANAARAESILMPPLEAAAEGARRLLTDSDTSGIPDLTEALGEALRQCGPMLPGAIRGPALAFGHAWAGTAALRPGDAALPQLLEGARSAAPLTCDTAGASLRALVSDFASSEEIASLGRFSERFARFLAATQHPLAELAHFEAVLAAPPRQDEEAELFGALPNESSDLLEARGTLRVNTTLRRWPISGALAEQVLGDAVEGELAAIVVKGEPRVIALDEDTEAILSSAASSAPVGAWLPGVSEQALEALLDNSFLVWLPTP